MLRGSEPSPRLQNYGSFGVVLWFSVFFFFFNIRRHFFVSVRPCVCVPSFVCVACGTICRVGVGLGRVVVCNCVQRLWAVMSSRCVVCCRVRFFRMHLLVMSYGRQFVWTEGVVYTFFFYMQFVMCKLDTFYVMFSDSFCRVSNGAETKIKNRSRHIIGTWMYLRVLTSR